MKETKKQFIYRQKQTRALDKYINQEIMMKNNPL